MGKLNNSFKKKSVLILGVANYGRTEVIRDYFIKNKIKNLYIIVYDGPYAANKESSFLHYKFGKLIKKVKYKSFTIKNLTRLKYPLVSIVFFYYLINTIKSIRHIKDNLDYSISVGTFLSACNIILKKITFSKVKTIYYSIDYYLNQPNYLGDFLSFQKTMINIFYRIDSYVYKQADFYWELTESIEATRKKILGKKLKIRKKYSVPLGYSKLFHEEYNKTSIKKKNIMKNRYALIGVVSKNQGLDLILKLLQKYKNKLGNIEFMIVGTGPYLNEFKELVVKLNLDQYFYFTGFLKLESLAKELSTVTFGITMFPNLKSNHSLSAEPGKIKLFYSLNTPIIISNNVLISKKIEEFKAGVIIEYNEDKLFKSIIKYQDDSKYEAICNNAKLFKKEECISDIHFDKAFKSMENNS